jgi:hypothetical protein
LGNKKLVLGNQRLIDLFQVAAGGNEMHVFRQLDVLILIRDDHVFGLLLADEDLKRSQESLTRNAEMQRCPVVHIQVPDETPPPDFPKRGRNMDSVGSLGYSALLIANRNDPCVTLHMVLLHGGPPVEKFFRYLS